MKKLFLTHTIILKHKKSKTKKKINSNNKGWNQPSQKVINKFEEFLIKILEEKEDSKLGKIIKQLYYNKKIIRNIKWNTQNEK